MHELHLEGWVGFRQAGGRVRLSKEPVLGQGRVGLCRGTSPGTGGKRKKPDVTGWGAVRCAGGLRAEVWGRARSQVLKAGVGVHAALGVSRAEGMP